MQFSEFSLQLPVTDPTLIFFLVLVIILFAPVILERLHIPHIVGLILAGVLSGILYERGIDSKGFAIIRSKGDKALFKLDTLLLKRKLGAPNNRPLADFLPTINIKAKDFAAEMTSVNVQQKDLHGQQDIEKEHVDNNSAVRKMMLDRGIIPENLPAGEDVKKVERRLKSEEKKLNKKKSDKKRT